VNKDGEDYNLVSTWIGAVNDVGSITTATTKVFSHTGITGEVADGATVTGTISGTTATVAHTTATQILVYAISGAGFQLGEDMLVSAGNSVTLSDTGDSCNLVCHVYDDEGEVLESASLNIWGVTVGPSNQIYITAPEGERHDGKKYGTGARINVAGSIVCKNQMYVNISWLGLYQTAVIGSFISLEDQYCFSKVNNCIITTNQVGANAAIYLSHYATDGLGYIINNIIYGAFMRGVRHLNSGTGSHIRGNTISGCTEGIRTTGSGSLINNLCVGNTTDYINNKATFTTNGSGDATGSVGLQNLTAAEFVSVTAGSEDFHLSESATAIDKGTDTGTTYSANIDIDGRDRDASEDIWDLGCDDGQIYVAPKSIGSAMFRGLNRGMKRGF
jgi:hypothetical protein